MGWKGAEIIHHIPLGTHVADSSYPSLLPHRKVDLCKDRWGFVIDECVCVCRWCRSVTWGMVSIFVLTDFCQLGNLESPEKKDPRLMI